MNEDDTKLPMCEHGWQGPDTCTTCEMLCPEDGIEVNEQDKELAANLCQLISTRGMPTKDNEIALVIAKHRTKLKHEMKARIRL